MIIQLEKTRFHYELKLKTEYGVPSYILESMMEPQLVSMIDELPKNPWKYYDREIGFSINLCERLATKFKVDNPIEKCKAYLFIFCFKSNSTGIEKTSCIEFTT